MKTKRTSHKRILSMLLTLAIVLTLLPATAFAAEYTLYYHANDGINAPAAESYTEGTNATLTGAGRMTKSGYVFLGWSATKLDDLSATAADPATITAVKVDGDKTVYAVWGIDNNGNGVWDKKDTDATYTVPIVKKTLTGTIPTGFSEVFNAKIEAVSTTVPGLGVGSMPMPAQTSVSTSAFTAADTKNFAEFGNITFTKEGSYIYKITETAGSTTGMTYDKSEYEITVTVTTNGTNGLEAFGNTLQTKDSDGNSYPAPLPPKGIDFTNTYSTPAAGPTYIFPVIKKKLTGTIPTGFSEVFNAKVEAVSTDVTGMAVSGMPMPDPATATANFTTADTRYFTVFGTITFTIAGTYVYKITETAGSTAGMTYDKSEFQITVKVYEGQNGLVTSGTIGQTKGSDGKEYPTPLPPNFFGFTNQYTKPSDPGGSPNNNVTRYTLTFDSNGGSKIDSITRTSGTTIDLTPYVPTREGYTFNGWYTDKSITEKVSSVKLTKDMTVYAGWTFNGALNSNDHVAYIIGYPDGNVGPMRNITRAETAMMLYRLLKPERRDEITVSTSDFPDVDINAWYGVATCSMANGKYIVGYKDGTFGGERQITRAEFVTMLVRFIGKADGTKSFSDVPTTHWAYEFISTATAAGWIDGYSDGLFGPEKLITRAEAMTIVDRVLNRGVDEDSELLDFKEWPDNPNDAWYYYDVIEATNAHEYTGARPSENWTKILK